MESSEDKNKQLPELPEIEDQEQSLPLDGNTGDIPVLSEVTPQVEEEQQPEVEEEDMAIEESYAEFSKEQLIDALGKLVEEDDITRVKSRIGIIKVLYNKILHQEKELALNAFVEEGGKREEFEPPVEPTFERYKEAFVKYREKKQKLDNQHEKIKLDNLQKKKDILEAIKCLINKPETLKKTYEEFNELQRQWRAIGQVPPAEANDLWQTYHFYVEKFFDYVKINKELKDLDLKKNLEAKILICEKTEELLLETSVNKSFQLLQQFHNEWKEIGPVPVENAQEIWERLKSSTDKVNKRRHEYYESLHSKQEENLAAKTALCERIEQIAAMDIQSSKEYEEKLAEITAIQNEWKSIGFAPKKDNAEIWRQFKTANDLFFEKRKEYYKKLRNDRTENLNLKIDLCVQAEAIKDSTDWKKTTSEFLKLQEEWTKLGPLPKKHADKIWKRFRAACDHYFTSKSKYFANIDEIQAKNLETKKELIAKIESSEFGPDNEANLQILKDFQRQWMEIGHVPNKEKDTIYASFRAVIDKQYDRLNLSAMQKTAIKFKHRIEKIKESGNSGNVMYKERTQLQTQISTLKSDIAIWENNIGFFSNSAKSNKLKEEFQEKIDKAKEKIVEMEAKMKIIREMK